MNLKTLLLHSLSNEGLIKKRQRLCFNNRWYSVSYQINGKFLTVKNIRKIVKNTETRQRHILQKKQPTVRQRSPVRQCIFEDKATQTHSIAIIQCKSTSVETVTCVSEEKAQQTTAERLQQQSTQTEIRQLVKTTQTSKNTALQVTQTETKFLTPNKSSQTSTLVTADHTIQTVPGYGMPDKRSQTPPLYTADNDAQTIPGYGMPDKRSQTAIMYTAHNKTQTEHYLRPDKNSQTLNLVTTDHNVQTISGYGMPNKKMQTSPLASIDHRISTVSANVLPEKRSETSQLILNSIPTFVANRTTQTDILNDIPPPLPHSTHCHNCTYVMKSELNDHKEQTQVEKDAVILMLNEIGEMIINQNYLLHNNSTLLGQISEMTLLQKMVSKENLTMKLRTKMENQRKIRNYIRERSKKIRYVYYQTTKLTKTSNALLQTIAYQLNVSTQTRKEDFPKRKTTKVRKFLCPLAHKFATHEARNHRKF